MRERKDEEVVEGVTRNSFAVLLISSQLATWSKSRVITEYHSILFAFVHGRRKIIVTANVTAVVKKKQKPSTEASHRQSKPRRPFVNNCMVEERFN